MLSPFICSLKFRFLELFVTILGLGLALRAWALVELDLFPELKMFSLKQIPCCPKLIIPGSSSDHTHKSCVIISRPTLDEGPGSNFLGTNLY
jgi:hypothetical protein